MGRALLADRNCRSARNKRGSDHRWVIRPLHKANNLCPCKAHRIRPGNAGSLCLNSWRMSYLSEQKSRRHWNNVAIVSSRHCRLKLSAESLSHLSYLCRQSRMASDLGAESLRKASNAFGNALAALGRYRLGNEPNEYPRAESRAPRRSWHS